MNAAEFRKELTKRMPGYKWVVHNTCSPAHTLTATGTQSSGSNRLSTLQVERRENNADSGKPWYEAKSSGYGTRSPWMHTAGGRTLAQALRNLQNHYERMARNYHALAADLKVGRQRAEGAEGGM
ncbi:hypothetical protein [Stutzerimonas nitrititolerans]|uniref:hypothetical protein n=1 Tax=Stutzerimonas nitrititolerans TaxID=2482751 RepID=UPI0028AA2F34|nr:hypothetical protein [Stutzerimonas nitrititolerans]